MATYDKLQSTATAWLESQKDASKLSSYNTPDATRYIGPQSLNALFGRSSTDALTNEAFEKSEAPVLAQWTSSEYKVKDSTVDEKAKKVVLSTINSVKAKSGNAYDFEHVTTLFLSDDGEKVKAIVQHGDALAVKKLMEGEGAAIKAAA